MNRSTLHTRLMAALLACLTTALMLGGIDGLAHDPTADSLLAQTHAVAITSAS